MMGTSRGPEEIPVLEMPRKSGFCTGLREARAAKMVRVASAQMETLPKVTIPIR